MLIGDKERAKKITENQKQLNAIRVIRSTGVNHSNMLNESNHAKKRANYADYMR